MKHRHGFTLLEVLTATAVVSILMPVLGLVFYQLLVIPPEENEHLTLANEVGLLASWLYRDGYMADNFSAGEAPFFGNFSWTDNSSDTHYLISYFYSDNKLMREETVTSNYSTTSSPIVTSNPIALSRHITSGNFSFEQRPYNLEVNITANSTTSMGKALVKELTIYIMPRPLHVETAEGGRWGVDPIQIGGSASSEIRISGDENMFNGDLKVDGDFTVTGNTNRVTGDLICDTLIDSSGGTFAYGDLTTPCPDVSLPDIGDPQLYFGTNLSEGITVLSDTDHEYVFNTSVDLYDIAEVWEYKSSTVKMLKPGMYYCNETITLEGKYIRGAVTLVADRIIISNPGGTGLIGNQIQIEPYYEDLLLWATGSDGTISGSSDGDIRVTGSAAWYPCVILDGVFYAPDGEIELSGNGATTQGWVMAFLTRCALVAQNITISGDNWFIYRW